MIQQLGCADFVLLSHLFQFGDVVIAQIESIGLAGGFFGLQIGKDVDGRLGCLLFLLFGLPCRFCLRLIFYFGLRRLCNRFCGLFCLGRFSFAISSFFSGASCLLPGAFFLAFSASLNGFSILQYLPCMIE